MLVGRRHLLPVFCFFIACSFLYIYSSSSRARHWSTKGDVAHVKANAPSAAIVAFWVTWSHLIAGAKPNVKPIEIVWNAKASAPKNASRIRKPTPQSIGLKKKDLDELKKQHKYFLGHEEFGKLDAEAARLYDGQGIVTVAGGQLLPTAILSIRLLRKTNSSLPVQVFMQAHEYEQEPCEEILPAMNAECYIFEDFSSPQMPFVLKSYQLKPLAILFSTFSSVVFLDADNIVLGDPEELLRKEPYLSYGLVTWPDYWIATEDRVFYTIAGVRYPKNLPAKSSESGQLLVDKARHLKTLMLATYYNVYGPAIYYQIFSQGSPGEGDKDTYLAAATVLNAKTYRVDKGLQTLGYREKTTQEFHGQAIVQWDPSGDFARFNGSNQGDIKPFFLHANTPKLNAAQLLYSKKLQMPENGEDIRIWGSKESNEKMIGFDVERYVWEEMVDMACKLQSKIKDWKGRRKICQKAHQHFDKVFP